MGHKIYVVGLGPGDGVYLTLQARAALEAADVLCGYTAYVALAAAQFPCKETYATGMREEIERCRWALATAAQGKTVALVCSGDAGVYGMAGLLLQMGKEFTDVDIEVVPGVTAALSGAALLGAPLGHDFCVISLSDLLTPWDVIEKRLRCAAAGDFVLCLYNPASRKRADYLRRACNVLLSAGTDVSIGVSVTSFTVVPVGSSSRLVTLSVRSISLPVLTVSSSTSGSYLSEALP